MIRWIGKRTISFCVALLALNFNEQRKEFELISPIAANLSGFSLLACGKNPLRADGINGRVHLEVHHAYLSALG